MDHEFDLGLPLEKASTIPKSWYFDPTIYAKEKLSIFSKSWLYAGLLSEVQKTGDFFTTEIADESLLVSRDESGKLNAMTNICRHRAAHVQKKEKGNTNCFQCRYHGWIYDLKGNLKGTPEWDKVEDFDRTKISLPKWSVDTWGPWVFVNRDLTPPPLKEFLDHLLPAMPEVKIEEYGFFKRVSYDMECNWKVFVDNYLDGGYHVRTIHPALASVINYAQYRTEVFDLTSVQISPLQASKAEDLNTVRGGTCAYYWWLFPNLMLNIYEKTMDTNLVIPIGPNRCRVVMDFFAKNVADSDTIRFMEESIAVAHQIQLEDVDICKDVYDGMRSESFQTGRFSVKRESGGFHFHQLIAKNIYGL